MRASLTRRRLIAGFGLTAAVFPARVVQAQRDNRPIIGFLRSTPAASFTHLEVAFARGLQEYGYVAEQTVTIVGRYADNDPMKLTSLARDLVQMPVSLIVGNSLAAEAARLQTKTIPIVFVTSDDPVARGLVQSLSRPAANLTGLTFFGGGQLGGKRVELLLKILPHARTIGFLLDSTWPGSQEDRSTVTAALTQRGLAAVSADVTTAGGLERAVATLASAHVDGVVVAGCPLFTSRLSELSRLLLRFRLPAIFDVQDHVEAGGLVSYGSSLADAYHGAGLYAGRLLKGALPSELPVIRPSVLEFALNQSTARALGLTIAPALLARVDTVVD